MSSSTPPIMVDEDNIVLHTREGLLRTIKSALQPLYNINRISKDEFMNLAKKALSFCMDQPFGSKEWTIPGVHEHLQVELRKIGVLYEPALVTTSTSVVHRKLLAKDFSTSTTPEEYNRYYQGNILQPSSSSITTTTTSAAVGASGQYITAQEKFKSNNNMAANDGTIAMRRNVDLLEHRKALDNLKTRLHQRMILSDEKIEVPSKTDDNEVVGEEVVEQKKMAMDEFYRKRSASPVITSGGVDSPVPRRPLPQQHQQLKPESPFISPLRRAAEANGIDPAFKAPPLLSGGEARNQQGGPTSSASLTLTKNLSATSDHQRYQDMNGKNVLSSSSSPRALIMQVMTYFEQRNAFFLQESSHRQELWNDQTVELVEILMRGGDSGWTQIQQFLQHQHHPGFNKNVEEIKNDSLQQKQRQYGGESPSQQFTSSKQFSFLPSPPNSASKISPKEPFLGVPSGGITGSSKSGNSNSYSAQQMKKLKVQNAQLQELFSQIHEKEQAILEKHSAQQHHHAQEANRKTSSSSSAVEVSDEESPIDAEMETEYKNERKQYLPSYSQSIPNNGRSLSSQRRHPSPRQYPLSTSQSRRATTPPQFKPTGEQISTTTKVGGALLRPVVVEAGAPPPRQQVIEFLREKLQPIYNRGELPQSAFVEIVRITSLDFFSKQWMGGTPELDQKWQAYLAMKISKIVPKIRARTPTPTKSPTIRR